MMKPAWQPQASIEAIARRAKLYADIRHYFSTRNVLEVDVPLLGRHGVTDVYIDNLQLASGDTEAYLQSSPEYFLKRLLAAYGRAVYYLGKAFREGESGVRHHREFTLLEWYRPAWDEYQLMDEVADLLLALGFETDIPVQRYTYRDAFLKSVGLDPHTASDKELGDYASDVAACSWRDQDRSSSLDLIFSLRVEPDLPMGLVFIDEYPAVQAALARLSEDRLGNPVARRFEAFLNGMEVANGYWELCDDQEQRARFEADNRSRIALGKRPMPIDENVLAALAHGLPECSGVALGLDRVLMQLLGAKHINEVLSFCELPD